MPTLSASLSGTITVQPQSQGGSSQQASGGCSFGMSLRDNTRAPALLVSQGNARVASPSTPVALPFPSNLRARFLYMRTQSSATALVTVTFATQGARVIPIAGLLCIEVAEDEQISAISVQGTVDFEWAAFGASTN